MDSIINEDLTTLENITPFLKQCVGKGKEIPPGSILQVQQVTNISFPTYDKPNYDADKHTLKITVTDGQSQGYAIVADGCPGLNLNTAPGTKIKTVQAVPVQGSLFVLTRSNCDVIGGRVTKLFEKWEIQKKMAIKHDWGYTGTSIEGEGPPPWKPFGYKPSIDVVAIRKMKTIDVVNDKKDGKPGPESKTQFDMQRDEAISELQGTANKQKFQKPNKHLLDKEITDIMEEGFSQGEAEYAMNRFKNIQKAIKFLKDAKKRLEGPYEPPKPPPERKEWKDRRKGKGKGIDDDEEQDVPAEYQRPTKSISLFGFIEGQIKSEDKPAQTNGPTSQTFGTRSRELEESMGRLNMKDSYSSGRYDRGRGRGGYRGGRGDSRGGRGDNNFNIESSFSQRYENKRFEDKRYDDKRFEDKRFDEKRFDEKRFDEKRFEDKRYDEKRFDEKRFDEKRFDEKRFDEKRFDEKRFEDKRYDDKSGKGDGLQKPPRFQSKLGSDSRPSDYSSSNSRGQSNSGSYDNYRGQSRDNYEPRSSYHHDNSSNRSQGYQDYSGNGQSHQPQQRPTTGRGDRSYSNDYPLHHHQLPPQQQFQRSDYPVPSQNYQPQQYQHQPQRQYMNSQNHEPMGPHRSSGSQRPTLSQYTNHSSGNQPPLEFNKYQYGYEDWNPAQSLVFTRSKPESRGGRGGGGYQGGSRGASQNTSYNRSNHSSRY